MFLEALEYFGHYLEFLPLSFIGKVPLHKSTYSAMTRRVPEHVSPDVNYNFSLHFSDKRTKFIDREFESVKPVGARLPFLCAFHVFSFICAELRTFRLCI